MKNLIKIFFPKRLLAFMMITAAVTSCDFFEDLEVENLNNPDKERLLANPEDYPSIMGGAYLDWWSASQKSEPQMPLSVAAQVMTASWGNWGMWDLGRIPSEPIQNSQTYNNRGLYEIPWYTYNGALAAVNDIMGLIKGGAIVVIDDEDLTNMVVANGKILQGLTIGHLGLLFDQAFVADEDSDLGALTFSAYPDVIDAAIMKFDEGIAIAAANTFTNPAEWIPGHQFTSAQLVKFANTMAARTLAYSARTEAETNALDWNKILAYTNNGIDFDFAPLGDGGIVWWDRIKIQGQDATWARVSQRVIAMMATNQASDPGAVYPWPDNTPILPEFTTADARKALDMEYRTSVSFIPTRGYYFFGAYRYKRFDAYRASFSGPMLAVSLTENNLLRAEALIRTGGNKTTAAQLINGSRVGRGSLPALTGSESNQVLLDAIFYERYVDLGWTSSSVAFFDRRRTDDLEPNRFTQLPVPARELNVLNLPVYTFGGSND